MATVERAHVEEEDMAETEMSEDFESLEHCRGTCSAVEVHMLH